MGSPRWFSPFLTLVVSFALCGGPELLQAQQTTKPETTQDQSHNATPGSEQSGVATAAQEQNLGTSQSNATPDPSKGPLQPEETTALPNAASSSRPVQQSQQQQPAEAPAGAAAAQGIRTAGGAASRPAGTAIAPAKQHQSRSLLIKIGVIAAGAATLGTIYLLSRGSSGVPPGAR